jgi:hypothetical protein
MTDTNKGSFKITNLDATGSSLGKLQGHAGAQYTTPKTSSGTQGTFGVVRQGELFGSNRVDSGYGRITQDVGKNTQVFVQGNLNPNGNSGKIGFNTKF